MGGLSEWKEGEQKKDFFLADEEVGEGYSSGFLVSG